jgi:hypothetical protein
MITPLVKALFFITLKCSLETSFDPHYVCQQCITDLSCGPKVSVAEVKDGAFVGADTRKLMRSQRFSYSLSPVELMA